MKAENTLDSQLNRFNSKEYWPYPYGTLIESTKKFLGVKKLTISPDSIYYAINYLERHYPLIVNPVLERLANQIQNGIEKKLVLMGIRKIKANMTTFEYKVLFGEDRGLGLHLYLCAISETTGTPIRELPVSHVFDFWKTYMRAINTVALVDSIQRTESKIVKLKLREAIKELSQQSIGRKKKLEKTLILAKEEGKVISDAPFEIITELVRQGEYDLHAIKYRKYGWDKVSEIAGTNCLFFLLDDALSINERRVRVKDLFNELLVKIGISSYPQNVVQTLEWLDGMSNYIPSYNEVFTEQLKSFLLQKKKEWIVPPSEEYNYKSSQYAYVNWKNVTFHDGYISVYNPKNKNMPPCRVDVPSSVSALNKIDSKLFNSFGPILLNIRNGRLHVIDIPEISDRIELLVERQANPNLMKTKIVSSGRNRYTQEQIRSLIQDKDSTFLSYLSKIHDQTSTLYYCLERRVNTDGIEEPEDAFLFTIRKNAETTTLVYENALPSRATIVFTVTSGFESEAVDLIYQYFGSTEPNKREQLIRYTLDFSKSGIVGYGRIIHDTFENWVNQIKNRV